MNIAQLNDLVTEYLQFEGRMETHLNNDPEIDLLSQARRQLMLGHVSMALVYIMKMKTNVLGDAELYFSLLLQLFVEIWRGEDITNAAAADWIKYANSPDTSWILRPLPGENDPPTCSQCDKPMEYVEMAELWLCDVCESFVEKTPKRAKTALLFCRNALTPLSYFVERGRERLESAMILFLSPEECMELLDYQRREDISALLQRTVLSAIGHGELPMLGLMLRYLVTINNLHCALTGSTTSIPIISKLLLPDRLPPSKMPKTDFIPSERDVQMLAQAVCVPRHEAVAALQNHGGDTNKAVISEMSRIQLDKSVILPIIQDYAEFQGFLKDERVGRIRELVNQSQWVTAMEAVENVTPNLLESNNDLRFIMYEGMAVSLFRQGQNKDAVGVVRKHLTPIAKKDVTYHTRIDDLMAMAAFGDANIDDASNAVISHVDKAIGLQDPAFLQLMQELLRTHTDFFNSIKSSDPFKYVFGITRLQETVVVQESLAVEFPDESISMICDAMGMSRDESIALLKSHDGDLEAVFATFFG